MQIAAIKELSIRSQSGTIFQSINFDIQQGEHYAIIGGAGSGKTSFLKAIAGQVFYQGLIELDQINKIVLVEQQHHFKNLSNTNNFYYQQRFNASESEDSMTVEDYLILETNHYLSHELIKELHIDGLLSKRLLHLSNGENKRVQLVKAVTSDPKIVLLDNAYTGLDAESRQMLNHLLEVLAQRGITILLTTSAAYIPAFITHVLELKNGTGYVYQKRTFQQTNSIEQLPLLDLNLLDTLLKDEHYTAFAYAVQMKDVRIKYNNTIILNGISWQVPKGDRWLLAGPNGSGKSTLLSLINADNPQGYANEIYLFDKRRGRGESIWDIKQKIGFVSPELHVYFDQSSTLLEVVASGLFDTIGLFRILNEEQQALAKNWMKLLHIDHLQNRLLSQVSAAYQRLALLARALIKNPPLLILDEPTQGLDQTQVDFFKAVIDAICMRSDKTLIYVSHYREDVPASVDKVFQLTKG